ncbi:hypothetical protein [Nostoc sphaeroides]|uniref:Uncharacterized protein n=1 Tax=Nostoc sphaeroides CCNUC1 TaxID=2653204 RepID=A0A5P8WGK9_9NOSO|nr:hypothetical protein [Nostoc sphaeroides]QFS51296.1 hypothetical protein GXM_08790 [Nostoc sphaeroides CCNUC1]
MTTQTTNINLDSPSLVLDSIFTWKGAGRELQQSNPNYWDSKCRLRIYRAFSIPTIIICSDLDEESTGTSITNSVENVATLIWKKYGTAQEFLSRNMSFVFIEHYPYHNRKDKKPENFSLVQFNWNGQQFSQPRWSPLTPNIVLALIQQPLVKN